MNIETKGNFYKFNFTNKLTFEQFQEFCKIISKPRISFEINQNKISLDDNDLNIIFNVVYSAIEKKNLVKKIKNIFEKYHSGCCEFYAKTIGQYYCYSLIFKLLGVKFKRNPRANNFIFTLADLHCLWAQANNCEIIKDKNITKEMVILKYIKKKYIMDFDQITLGNDFKQNWVDPFDWLDHKSLFIIDRIEETGNIVYCLILNDVYPCKISILK